MSDPGAQQGMALQKVNIRGPREALAARAPVEPLVPETKDPPIELPQTSVVRRASVVLVVAPQFRIEVCCCCATGSCRCSRHHSATALKARARRFFIDLTCTVNFPLRLRAHLWVKPRKSNVAGLIPNRAAVARVLRPNSTRRVFSGWSVSPNFANLLGSTRNTLCASSRY